MWEPAGIGRLLRGLAGKRTSQNATGETEAGRRKTLLTILAVGVWVVAAILAVVVIARSLPGRAPVLAPEARAIAYAARFDPQLEDFYRARGFRPLWFTGRSVRPEASVLIAALRNASADGLSPASFEPDRLAAEVSAAAGGDRAARAGADVALSRALASYIGALRTPPPNARMYYSDRTLGPPATAEFPILQQAASAPSLSAWIAAARDVNPIYDQLRDALPKYASDPARAAVVRENMERARALPAALGDRYILVNAPSQRLWLYNGGRATGTMEVVVGKPSEQTPVMSGVIRFAMLHPYWNVPPDLVRDKLTPQVMKSGLGVLKNQHMQVLSDWSPNAVEVDPATVDWASVETGVTVLRVRQLPGPDNMMGAVKFMFPNAAGVYLHDTPLRGFFASHNRLQSAGCVRLQRPGVLGAWLFGRDLSTTSSTPEQRVDLPHPTPVWITYFTALPTPNGIVFPKDIYGRDPATLATLKREGRLASRSRDT